MSYSARVKLGWLAILLAMILTVCCYFSHLKGLSPSQQHGQTTRKGMRLTLNQTLDTVTVLENGQMTEYSELPRADDFSNRFATLQNPNAALKNSWNTVSSQDQTRTTVFNKAISSNLTDSEELGPDMDTAVVGEATWSDFTEKAQAVESIADTAVQFQDTAWLESAEEYDCVSNRISTPISSRPGFHENESSPIIPTTSSQSTELLFGSLEHIINSSDPHYAISTRFRSWEKGVVTQLGIPIIRDCHKLRMNTTTEVKRVNLQSQVEQWRSAKPWEQFALRFKEKSCDEIRAEFENNFYVSELEKEFPIAYIFVVYTNAGQVLRLLKSIYRPHNLYCIHPDARQGQGFASFFKTVAKSLDNVFIVSKPVRVYYGHISITDAQLHCMQDLMTYPQTRWKYVINLCGREVPLKTNREIVESLVKMKGYTALNLRNMTEFLWNDRFRLKFYLNQKGSIKATLERQLRPPQEIKIYKSMNFMAASWDFVYFLLHDPLSLKLREYLKTVYAPEEHFYSSLYALPQAKGARPPRGTIQESEIPIVNKCIWITTQKARNNMQYYCPGQRIVHDICTLTGPDLGRIEELGVSSKQPVFFFNKYFLEWDPTAMDCMEERLVKTNMDEYKQDCFIPHRH